MLMKRSNDEIADKQNGDKTKRTTLNTNANVCDGKNGNIRDGVISKNNTKQHGNRAMTVNNTEDENSFNESCRFIEVLVKAWQLNGVSSRTMVMSLSRIAKALGLKGEFLATPHYVQTVLKSENEGQQRVYLTITRSGNFNLAKLAQMMVLADEVEAGAVQPADGIKRLQNIMLARDVYGPLAKILAFMFCGASFAVILGASWIDTLIGSFVSMASYGISIVAARSSGVAALQELLAACAAAILAAMGAVFFPGVNPTAVAICAIIWFVPGFGLTIAPNELMVGNTLSGVIWFTNAAVAALKLFGGYAIGTALAANIGLITAAPAHVAAIAPVWEWVAVPVLIISLATLMKVSWWTCGRKVDWRTLCGLLLGGWLTWGSVQLGAHFGHWQGNFVGSAVLMIYANWYAPRFRVPSVVILLPCVMILLPGVAALQVVDTASTEGILAGFRSAYNVTIRIVAIIGGSLVGDSLAVNKLLKTGKAMRSLVRWPPSV